MQVSKRWTPVAIWMALIFAFSTDWFAGSNTISFFGSLLSWLMPGIAAETIQIIHAGLRKLGHWTEYFILATLVGDCVQSSMAATGPAQPFYRDADYHHALCNQRRVASILRA